MNITMTKSTTEKPNFINRILNPRNFIIGTAATLSLMPMPNAYAGAASTGPTPDTTYNPTGPTPSQVINNPSSPTPNSINYLPNNQPPIPTTLQNPVTPTNSLPIYNNGGNIGAINSGYLNNSNNTNNCGFGANLSANSGYNQTPVFSATIFANSTLCPNPAGINSVTQNAETQRTQIQTNAQKDIACGPLRLDALKNHIDPDKVCPLPKAAREVIINTK